MKASGDELSAALRAELRRLDGGSLQQLLQRFKLPEDGRNAAVDLLADPKWSRDAVRTLSPRARAALRILVRTRHGAHAAVLDAALELLPPDPPGCASPARQLVARNLVTTSLERRWGRPEEKLSVLDSLRERFAVLAEEERRTIPAPPTAEEELFALTRFEWQIGVAVAVVDQARPRATMSHEPHRADFQNICKLLTPLFGTAELADSRLRVLLATKLFAVVEDRIRPVPHAIQECESPVILLQSLLLSFRKHSSVLRAMLGALLSTEGWVPREEIVECACTAMFQLDREWDVVRRVEGELAGLADVPGVEARSEGGRVFLRLTAYGREAVERTSHRPVARHEVLVQPNLQLVVSPGAPFRTVARLGCLAKLVSADQVAIFTIDEPTIRRSAINGTTAGEMLALLEEHATHGVPSTVVRAVSDWARVKGHARLGFGALLLVDLSMEELRRIVGNKVELHVVKEGAYFAPDGRLTELVKALRKAGVSCAPYPEDVGPSDEEAEEEELDEDFVFENEVRPDRWSRAPDPGASFPEAEQFREEWKKLMRVVRS